MGFEFWDYHSAEAVEMFDEEYFDSKFRIRGPKIVSRLNDYARLKEIADLR